MNPLAWWLFQIFDVFLWPRQNPWHDLFEMLARMACPESGKRYLEAGVFLQSLGWET